MTTICHSPSLIRLALLLLLAAPAALPQSHPAGATALGTPAVPPADAAPAADVPSLASLDLPLETLAGWGRREFTYRMLRGGTAQDMGTVVLTTQVQDGRFTFTDRTDLQWQGAPYWLELSAAGPLRGELRPQTLDVKGTTDDGDGATFEFKATFDAASASVDSKGNAKTREVPAGTLSDAALHRLVTLLPRRKGFVARFERFLDASEMLVKPGGTITCTGQETVEAGGKKVEAWRFDVDGGDGREAFYSAWVDGDGRLLQGCFDGYKLLVAKG